jgi:hypothetical protein
VLQHTAAFQQRGCSLQFLQNTRTAGASGAWNTGILHIMQQRMLQDSSSSTNAPSGDSVSLCSNSSSSGVGVTGSSKHAEDPCADVFVAFLGKCARGRVRQCSVQLLRRSHPVHVRFDRPICSSDSGSFQLLGSTSCTGSLALMAIHLPHLACCDLHHVKMASDVV